MIDQLENLLLDNWNEIYPHLERPNNLRFLITKGNVGGYGGRVTFLVFPDNDFYPVVAVKIVRNPKYDQLLTVEYDALKYIHSSLKSSLKNSVPRAFLLTQVENYKVLIEEAMAGKSFDAIIASRFVKRKRVAYHKLSIISNWLTEFKSELAVKENYCINELNQGEYFFDPVENFLKVYDISDRERDFLERIENSISDIVQQKYPLVFQHGDFSPINIIFFKTKFWVIDWECAQTKSLPFFDLFSLLIWINFYNRSPIMEGTERLNNFAQIFFKNGGHSAIATKLIENYCDTLKVSTSFVKTFLTLFLIYQANNEYIVLGKRAQRSYLPIVRPFDQGKSYKDSSLLKNGMYINLFHKFAENNSQFIF